MLFRSRTGKIFVGIVRMKLLLLLLLLFDEYLYDCAYKLFFLSFKAIFFFSLFHVILLVVVLFTLFCCCQYFPHFHKSFS